MKKGVAITIAIGILVALGYFGFRNADVAVAPEEGSNVNEGAGLPSGEFSVTPVSHASFIMTLGDTTIFNDPVGDPGPFTAVGLPDIVLLSDIHGDHLSTSTLMAVVGPQTLIIAPQEVFDELPGELLDRTSVLANGEESTFLGVKVEAVPMYNLPMEGPDYRHVKGRGNGYVLTQGETRVYIAGDTEDTEEFRAQEAIDYAFVPMNLPYTMGIEAAADGVLEMTPQVVIPYHYRGPDGLSDVQEFSRLVNEGNPTIEVRLLEWYPED